MKANQYSPAIVARAYRERVEQMACDRFTKARGSHWFPSDQAHYFRVKGEQFAYCPECWAETGPGAA